MGELIYYIYVFKKKSDGTIIYVGSTRTIGDRINGHRRSMREAKRRQPIHKYLISNNLQLITDVEISIIDFCSNKEEALLKEMYYYDLYKINTLNIWKGEVKCDENSACRRPILYKGISYKSVREWSKKTGINRALIGKYINSGEAKYIDIESKYKNITTGEIFISGYQIAKKYNITEKTIDKLSKKGSIVINGELIKKM